ncbi:MAG: Ig-like domain-containing protein [bacterium]|nr:Ig-like domain-containing protein [bacterium]
MGVMPAAVSRDDFVPTIQKTYVKTSSGVMVAASLMVAISSVALFVGWGMLAIVGVELTTEPSTAVIATMFSCSPISGEPFGVVPEDNPGSYDPQSLRLANQDLWLAVKHYEANANEVTLADVQQLAQERKKLLVIAMRQAPEVALDYVLPESLRSRTRFLAPNCVEEQITVSGTTRVLHADFFAEGTSQTQIQFMRSGFAPVTLHPAWTTVPVRESGITATIAGYLLDDELLFDARRPLTDSTVGSGIIKSELPGNPPVLGEQRIAVLPVYLEGQGEDVGPARYAGNILQDLVADVGQYYVENSYGLATLRFDIFPPRVLDTSAFSCGWNLVESTIIPNFDPLVDYRNYRRILIFATCGEYQGQGTIGAVDLQTNDGTIHASIAWVNSFDRHVTAHELGHNFGRSGFHASFFPTLERLNDGDYHAYGDPTDVMGLNDFAGHFSAGAKEVMGWMGERRVAPVTLSGRYELEPLETNRPELKVLKIRRAATPESPWWNQFLYVEYRQPIGYDRDINRIEYGGWTQKDSDVFAGTLIHLGEDFLLDVNPSISPKSGYYETIALLPGLTLTDPSTGTRITGRGSSGGKFAVEVSQGKPDLDPPSIRIINPTLDSTIAGIVAVQVEVTDPSGIADVEFCDNRCDGRSLGHIVPTAGQTLIGFQWDTRRSLSGPNYFRVTATDRSSEGFQAANNIGVASVPIIIDQNDPLPPTVAFNFPRNNESDVFHPVFYSVQAEDNVGVSSVALFGQPLDIIICELQPPPPPPPFPPTPCVPFREATFNKILDHPPYQYQDNHLGFRWNVEARARDFVGNITKTTISFTKATRNRARGDANDDSQVDMSDAVYLLNFLFRSEGEILPCWDAGDANGDGALNISDPIFLLNFLFLGGESPGPLYGCGFPLP